MYVPPGHGTQAVAPSGLLTYMPFPHVLHDFAPVMLEKVPPGHGRHSDSEKAYVPVLHTVVGAMVGCTVGLVEGRAVGVMEGDVLGSEVG